VSWTRPCVLRAHLLRPCLYCGRRLQVKFTDRYPLDPPEVMFLTPTPVHPHIYTNGHICLDIL
jgi:ubiquitin-protein ligase